MKKNKNKKRNKFFLSITTLLILNFLAHRAWFNPFVIISNGDWVYLYPETLKISQTASWISAFQQITPFGGANVLPSRIFMSVMGQIFANLQLTEQALNMFLFFFPVWLICPISSFFLLYKFTKNSIASFVGSLFYIFSTIFLVNSSGGYTFIIIYACVPLLFLLFDNLLEKFSLKNIFLFLLIAAYLNLHAIYLMLIIYGILVVYALFVWKIKKKSFNIKIFLQKKWKHLLLFIITGVGTNFYLILFSLSEIIKSSVDTGITSRAIIIPGYLFFDNAITTFYPFWTGTQPTMFYNQPVSWYFWFIPIYVFLSIFFVKKNKYILFFLIIAICMIFLGKGPTEPFGKLYEFAYDYIPLFNIYREASKFWIGIIFSYSILIAFTVSNTFSYIDKKYNSYKNSFLKIFFVLPLLLVIFLSAKPAFTTAIGPGYTSYTIPTDYLKLKDYLSMDNHFYRILQMPAFSRMMYLSEIHPRLAYNGLPPHLQSIEPAILRLYAIKYVLLPIDPYYDVFPGNSSREVYKAGIKEKTDLLTDKSFQTDEVEIYKNTIGSVPHIYPITSFNYVSGEMKSINDLYPLFLDQRSNFYIESDDKSKLDIPMIPSESIILSSCVACTNTTASESSIFSSFTTNNEGSVEVFIKKYGIKDIIVHIDKEIVSLDSGDGMYFQGTHYLRKGSHDVFVTLNRKNLADNGNNHFIITGNKKGNFTIPENKLLDHTPYTFSFAYKLPEKVSVNYTLDQNTDFYFQYQQNKPGGTPWKASKGELVGDNTWKQFETSFTTLFNPEWIRLSTEIKAGASQKQSEFKNISLIANITPQIAIKQIKNTENSDLKPPELLFQQINPTKYIVKVKDAKKPFILVFAESYNKNWQASYTNENLQTAKRTIPLETDMKNVKEIPYKNSYDLYNLFFADNKKHEIKNHFQINGFANAWYVDQKGDFLITLEFRPQKDFMFGVVVAGIMFFIGVILLIILYILGEKRKEK